MVSPSTTRRAFLLSGSSGLTAAWLGANWPVIVRAAQHAHHGAETTPGTFAFLTPAQAADVEALTVQIVPDGKTPGARAAHAVYFIDQAMATFFSWRAAQWREGLAQFQRAFRDAYPQVGVFARADAQTQMAWLHSVETTPFFGTVRQLTILGMFADPKYGGNAGGEGWKSIGFEDQHVFIPPFGYYDAHYEGFVPYPSSTKPGEQPS
jgi:Gluconate 2-dehydrogenase subunit 3